MVETVNNLLQPQALNAWRDLNASEQQRAATKLLDTVEDSAFVLADNLLKTDIVRENTDNIRKGQIPSVPRAASGRVKAAKPGFGLGVPRLTGEGFVRSILDLCLKHFKVFLKSLKE